MKLASDYSAAHTRQKPNADLVGHGMALTIGWGNDLCTPAARMTGEQLVGKPLDELTANMDQTWRK